MKCNFSHVQEKHRWKFLCRGYYSAVYVQSSSGKKNFPRYRFVSFRFVHCFICEISYEISCLMHNHIFIWARELTTSRTKYRLGFCEISYELSRVKYNGRGFVTNVSNTERKSRSNNRCLGLNQSNIIHSNLIETDKLVNKSCLKTNI